MSSPSKVFVIINGASGAKKAKEIYDQEVLPFIKKNAPSLQIQEFETEQPGHATTIVEGLIKEIGNDSELNLVLLGGDGTTHEVVNGLVKRTQNKVEAQAARIAIIPTGTANALYASLYAKEFGADFQDDKLRSLRSFLSSGTQSRTYPLALSLIQIHSSSGQSQDYVAHLITSHALHASILADSEALRDQYPGIERFKMAFGQNMAIWVSSSIELKPLQDSQVQIYDPSKNEYVNHSDTKIDDAILYFACVTTDRLEPSFVPAPFSGPVNDKSNLSRPSDAVDIVIYRPQRSPKFSSQPTINQKYWIEKESESTRQQIGQKALVHISGLMYQEGKHVDLTYKTEKDAEDEFEEKGNGPAVIEYYRCAGYSWKPNEPKARRTCIDGTVIESDQTDLRVLRKDEGAGRIVICK